MLSIPSERTDEMKKSVAFSAMVVVFLAGIVAGYFLWKCEAISTTVQAAEVKEVVKATPEPVKKEVVSAPVCEERQYTTIKGDTLWGIANKQYGGRAYLYQLLAEKNGVKNPNLILADQKMVIPCCLCDLPALESSKSVAKVSTVARKENKVARAAVSTPAIVPPPAPVVVPVAPVAPASTPAPAVAPVPAPAPTVQAPVPPKETAVVIPAPAQTKVPVATAPTPSFEKTQSTKSDTPFVRVAPGSTWNSFGFSPIERGNKVNYFHADQGVILGELPGRVQFEPYVAVNATKDTKGFSWDNKVKAEAGVKLVKAFPLGMLSVGTAYASETRKGDVGNDTKSGLTAYTEGWFGWDQTTPGTRTSLFSSLPGNSWFNVGNTSPFEKGNVIGVIRAEQGVTMVKTKRLSLIPDAWGQVGFDTQGKPWNNRYLYGGGMKMTVPWSSGVLAVRAGYECAKEYGNNATSSSAMCGPVVSADLWTGWRKKMGGR